MASGRTPSLHSLPHPRPLPGPEGNSEGVCLASAGRWPPQTVPWQSSPRGPSPPLLPGSDNNSLAESWGDGKKSFRVAPPGPPAGLESARPEGREEGAGLRT